MAALRKLSELEGVCLGIVFNNSPCTAYRVRRELLRSPSSHWQASAGSVYPLLQRLESDGLVSARDDTEDGRGRRLLHGTAPGRQALRAWIKTGTTSALASSITDPIRSRMFFLETLRPADRVSFVDGAIEAMQEFLEGSHQHLADTRLAGDDFEYFGALGATKLAEARLDWLRAVRTKLAEKKFGDTH